jgi:transcription elongation GreA/GreB family factor
MDKQALIDQIAARLRDSAAVARRAWHDAAIEAREGATPAEKREDARVALEQGGLARGQSARASQADAQLSIIERFRASGFVPSRRVALGAVVEVEDDQRGRTFFLAPVGAGMELTGPDGDGILSVVTPESPIGRAVFGRSVGETVEVVVAGEPREWTITFVD